MKIQEMAPLQLAEFVGPGCTLGIAAAVRSRLTAAGFGGVAPSEVPENAWSACVEAAMQVYDGALADACILMDTGLEPTSALKQAASDRGIAYGQDMQWFVEWARERLNEDG
jgi:hypothetical protein